MLPLNHLSEKLAAIVARFQTSCATNCLTLVQVEVTDHDGQKQTFCGFVSDVVLVSELPGTVALNLKLQAPPAVAPERESIARAAPYLQLVPRQSFDSFNSRIEIHPGDKLVS